MVISLKRTPSSSQFTLTCISTTSPPTTVVWTKDGTTLTMDGAPYQHSQVMTDRYYSMYSNILTSTEDPDIAAGTYTCTVSNRFGSSSKSAVIILYGKYSSVYSHVSSTLPQSFCLNEYSKLKSQTAVFQSN